MRSSWRRRSSRPEAPRGAHRRQPGVVAHAHVEHEPGVLAVLGDHRQPGADRVLGRAQLARLAVDADLAGAGLRRAEQALGDLRPAAADEPEHADDLARPDLEADVLEDAVAAQAVHREQRRRAGSGRRGGKTCARSRPAISRTISSSLVSAGVLVATMRPSLMTVTRSAISMTSSSRWDT